MTERLHLRPHNADDAEWLHELYSQPDFARYLLDEPWTAEVTHDKLTELLVDLDDIYNKCDPAERRILNRALFTRITIDDEENATYTPDETTASVLAHTSLDAPAHVTAETKLPRHQAGQFRFSHLTWT